MKAGLQGTCGYLTGFDNFWRQGLLGGQETLDFWCLLATSWVWEMSGLEWVVFLTDEEYEKEE